MERPTVLYITGPAEAGLPYCEVTMMTMYEDIVCGARAAVMICRDGWMNAAHHHFFRCRSHGEAYRSRKGYTVTNLEVR